MRLSRQSGGSTDFVAIFDIEYGRIEGSLRTNHLMEANPSGLFKSHRHRQIHSLDRVPVFTDPAYP